MEREKNINRKRERTENPTAKSPKYRYEDHVRYAKEKLKSVEYLTEEETRRFKDGAVKIISEIYEKHTGLVVDMNKPPPIAIDLSRSGNNATAGASHEVPSTSFKHPEPVTTLRQSLRAHSEEYLMGSTSDDVMIAKKSYCCQPRSRRHRSRKHTRRSHTSTSSSSNSPVPPVSSTDTSLTIQVPAPTSPVWYILPSTSTNVPKVSNEIINLDSDDE